MTLFYHPKLLKNLISDAFEHDKEFQHGFLTCDNVFLDFSSVSNSLKATRCASHRDSVLPELTNSQSLMSDHDNMVYS